MEKRFAEMKSIAFAEYVKDFWQRCLGKPHYEREIMDAGLVMKKNGIGCDVVRQPAGRNIEIPSPA
jgi:hypothetical protein